MIAAFFWGALAASSLLLGAALSYMFAPGRKTIAAVMALGSGLLIGSVAFDLVDEALKTSSIGAVTIVVLSGAAVFTIGNWLLARNGAAKRKSSTGGQADGSPLAILMGSILDGIPESFVLGLTVLMGGISPSLLVAVTFSNLPEGMGSSSGMRAAGWPMRRVFLIWSAVVIVSGLSAAVGYLVLDPASGRTGAMAQAFAGGALLTMLADTMLPEAFAVEGVFTGSVVALGFAFAIALKAL